MGQLIIRSYCNKFQAVFCGCSGYGGRNVGWIKSGTVLPNGAVSFPQDFGLNLVFVSAICIFFHVLHSKAELDLIKQQSG